MCTDWAFPVDNAHFLPRGNTTEWNYWEEIVFKFKQKHKHASTPNSPFSHHSQTPPWLLHNCRFPPCILAGCSLVSSPPRRSLPSGASAAPSARHLLAGTLAETQTISIQHRNKEGAITDKVISLKCWIFPRTRSLWKSSLLFLSIESGRNKTYAILWSMIIWLGMD